MSLSAVPVYPSDMDMKIEMKHETQQTCSTALMSGDYDLSTSTNNEPEFEEVNLEDNSEATNSNLELEPKNVKSEICMKGMFVCHADPECRACKSLPFRRCISPGYDSPHLSEALDIASGTWVKVPRVYPDTPLAPWMDNYIIPDLERENRQ
ncbi:protein V32-like protein [Phocid alphaherpesvirus 1]|uniref:Protein V32-like protein n=1 Tax=Phocid alphaherpesvirus 1 TaxID=47418 RepID=A0A482F3I8_9ALPH|nr:protein V32-like protein [Phocid alphaherpesvirus 1]QBN85147.1 protein V32-like protein [Phocid alphaherpesvirus 1]UNP64254.1 protein V32-like protein [Phocid alphaherpesvirus 1]